MISSRLNPVGTWPTKTPVRILLMFSSRLRWDLQLRRDLHWSGIPTTKRGFMPPQVRTAHHTPHTNTTRGTPQARHCHLGCQRNGSVAKTKRIVAAPNVPPLLLSLPLLLRLTQYNHAVKPTPERNKNRYDAVRGIKKRNSCSARNTLFYICVFISATAQFPNLYTICNILIFSIQ